LLKAVKLKAFPQKIRHQREQRGLSRHRFGQIIGHAGTCIRDWENGLYLPHFDTLTQLSVRLGLPMSYWEEQEGIHHDTDVATDYDRPKERDSDSVKA